MTTLQLTKQLALDFILQFPGEAAGEIEQRPANEAAALLKSQPADIAAHLLTYLTPNYGAELLETFNPSQATPILEKLERRDAAQIIAQWDPKIKQHFLKEISPAVRKEIQELLSYSSSQAGFFMDLQIITFPPQTEVKAVRAKLQSKKVKKVFNVFVVDENKKLLGIVPLAELLLASGNTPLDNIMISNPYVVSDLAPREEAIETFEKSHLSSLPVINFEGRLLGVIRQSALVEAVEQEALSNLQTMVGAGSEERALSKVFFSVKKRLPWLHINLATAFLAAAVVGIFEGTIAKFTALAVLLPVVAGQSGNSGAQALAVTLRGLALREVRVRQWPRIAFKETRVGLINGVAVAVTTGIGVFIWSRSLGLSLVIGLAMVISMMAAGLAGAVIPLSLTALKQDPAQSSSIFLTTVTDIVGFLSFLGLATLMSTFL